MTDARVARRYARALINAATKQNIVPNVEADLDLIASSTGSSPKFSGFLTSPNVSTDHKLALFEKVFADRVTALTMGFLRLLAEKNREGSLPLIREIYTELRREREKVVRAHITTIRPLEQSDRDRVVQRLESKSGKKVEAEFEIDPNIIGGISVRWGDYVLDGSLSGSLARLKESLLFNALKQN